MQREVGGISKSNENGSAKGHAVQTALGAELGLLLPLQRTCPCSAPVPEVPGRVKRGWGLQQGKRAVDFAVGGSVPAPCPCSSLLPDSSPQDCHPPPVLLGQLGAIWGLATACGFVPTPLLWFLVYY